jgi:hypothetical protein
MCISVNQLRYATYPKFFITPDHKEYDAEEGYDYKFKPIGGQYHGNKEIDHEEDDCYQGYYSL